MDPPGWPSSSSEGNDAGRRTAPSNPCSNRNGASPLAPDVARRHWWGRQPPVAWDGGHFSLPPRRGLGVASAELAGALISINTIEGQR